MATVTSLNEVSLNGVLYPVKGVVQSVLASIYPAKVTIGDYTRDSQQRASVVSWSDWRGGIGLWKMKGQGQADRSWWSTCQLRYHGHLVLPGRAVLTADPSVAGSWAVGFAVEFNNEIYAAFGTTVKKYNNTTDSWGSSLATLPAGATDAIVVRMGGTLYLVIATTGGYTYTADGVTWVDDTQDTLYLTYWNDTLYGIATTGLLWKSTTIGTETSNQGQLPLPDGSVTDLFVARDAAGDPIIYAATKVGLYAHDATNVKFVETELKLPHHPYGGKGSTKWRDSVFTPAGLGIYRYINGANSAVVTIMGPDRDHGLPSDKRGTIKQLIASHNDLLAIVDGTTAPGTGLNLFATGGLASHRSQVITADTGYSCILGWNETGWETKWLGGLSAKGIDYAVVANAYDVYRLWWASNQRIYYMALPSDIINPNEISTFQYDASAEHETPWFDADQADVDKLAIAVRAEVDKATSTEVVTVSYGTNYGTGWTSLGSITADGVTEYQFPNSTTPTGTVFRAIRFKLSLARGSTNTLTPDVVSLTFIYRKKLPAKWGHAFEVDLSKEYKGNSPKQLRANLLAAAESTTLVEFTFRDDTGGTRNFYVDVMQATGLEYTGHDERGASQVLAVEV